MCWATSRWETLVSCPPLLLCFLSQMFLLFFASQRPHLFFPDDPCIQHTALSTLFLLRSWGLDSRRKNLSLAHICCLPSS